MKNQTLVIAVLLVVCAIGRGENTPDADSALQFLYKYMPVPDRAMYDEVFWRANVKASLQAKSEMPWGATVPQREWQHFVLPVRVNNENLDLSRPQFYAELKERVKGLTMEQAILEVNHWCHEKVTYRPSDARTSSPLSCVSQAIGRCGEESTFTVAALRSVGIPARQVYTPRWAHTDDNHAWVEAWANGRWHFLGACEPEPILDLAWFNQPASRGMMMHTNVFGDYRGPEEVMERNAHYTTINVTENYAPTSVTTVVVTDETGEPVKGATVKFMVYNYAEYYPMASKQTDADGKASLRTGRGDMIVWAAAANHFGVNSVSAGDTLNMKLPYTSASKAVMEFDLIPPSASATLPEATSEQRAENNRRLVMEDSIRNAYTATFATSAQAHALANKLGLDTAKLEKVLVESRGNHRMISGWLETISASDREKALALLLSMSEKDRRDVTREVLNDHLIYSPKSEEEHRERYDAYVLNPRVENEGLTPYKQWFQELFGAEADAYRQEPLKWLQALRGHVRERRDGNPKLLRMSPYAVWNRGESDALSASICFVAGLRSIGIPARIDQVTGNTQYVLKNGNWQDVSVFGNTVNDTSVSPSEVIVKAKSIESPIVDNPRYYSNFSLSKIGADLFPRQMEYPEGESLSEWLAKGPRLDAGQYMLTTGQRLANGGVLAHSEIFTVSPDDKEVNLDFVLRHDSRELQVIGSLDAETLYLPLGTKSATSLLSTAGRGYYVLGIIAPNHEPSAHVLNDISAISDTFGSRPEQMILLFENSDAAKRFNNTGYHLPANVHFGIDADGTVMSQLRSSLNIASQSQLPVIVIADSFGRIVWVSEGYTIGLGDTLLQLLKRL